MSIFKVAVVGFFGFLALVAVLIFATSSTGGRGGDIGNVELWGSLPEDTVDEVILAVSRSGEDGMRGVSYTEFSETELISQLVEAIASGRGPDLVLIPVESVFGNADKLIPISYNSLSRRDFQDSYIEAGEALLVEEGMLGLPFYIDPYVLFWNRTLFSAAGLPRAPRYWDEVTDMAPRLSRSNESGTLTQSAIALGEWDNIRGAKDIFLSLVFGLGNQVITRNVDGSYRVLLSDRQGESTSAGESAIRYYIDFSDPVKTVYSWNRSRPFSFDAFTAGTLAMYLGRASELTLIRATNPNLNFDIARYPEVRGGALATPARVYALAVPRGSRNASGALQAAAILASSNAQRILVETTGLPSVRRDVLSVSPQNPYEGIFRDSALSTFVFIDPNPTETNTIFKRMIEGVSSGRLRVPEAVRSGQDELQALIGVR